ncbi:hypothetical protein LQW54_007473 [Pestalotiopsis sp. IQ-011]
MGQGSSTPLADCLNTVCNGRSDCVAFSDALLYQALWVKPYNLDLPVTPIAVARPETADDVSAFIKCAVSSDVKVQAKSGGHSYAEDLVRRHALKGAGAGFGVITEFVVKTHPEPGSVVQYSFTATFEKHVDMVDIFDQWQSLISDPDLDRRFGSEIVMHELGLVITATFYGTQDEFDATGIPDKIPAGKVSVVLDDWLGVIAQQAEDAALYLSDIQSAFTSRSLAFRQDELLATDEIKSMMTYLDETDRGTLLWFLIFDVSGGAVNDIAMNATAYSHRDKIMFCQGYGIGVPTLSQTTKDFMNGLINNIQSAAGQTLTTYPGYVDPLLTNAQESYWGPNLERLGQVKSDWDANDVFHNPQSVRPATLDATQQSKARNRRRAF